MRIVPDPRLLLWTAMLLPFALLCVVAPAAVWLGAGLFLALAVAAGMDAARTPRELDKVRVSAPERIRMARRRPGNIELRIQGAAGRVVRLGLPLPPALHGERELLDVELTRDQTDATASWSCTPRERGCYNLRRCYFELSSPWGLWRGRSFSELRCEVRVYPNLGHERRRLAALFMKRGRFGHRPQRMIGQGRDFEKLREYIPGDSFDEIHWKATAKRGRPVTKLFQIERTQEIYVAIDNSRLSARRSGEDTGLERAVNAALTLGLVTQQQGDLFGLAVFGDRVHRFIRAAGGKNHYGACRDALYTLRSSNVAPDFEEFFSFVRLRIRRRALLLVVTDLSDPVISEAFLRDVQLVRRQHLVKVAMVRPPTVAPLFSRADARTSDDVYRKLGGHLIWRSLRELERSLARQGVGFALVDNEKLAAEVVSEYMNVKARQVL